MPKRQLPQLAEPTILAVPLRERSRGRALPILSDANRAALAEIGSLVQLQKGSQVYRAGSDAHSIYNLVQGAVKTMCSIAGEPMRVSGFHFAGDIFGLAEQGKYVDSAAAVVPSVVYSIPLDALEDLLARNGELAVGIVHKLIHGLRTEQRRALILSRNDAMGKVAMFLQMVQRLSGARGPGGSIFLPMTRSDLAEYVGLTIESVSRACTALEKQGIVSFVDRHHFHLLDHGRLETCIAAAKDRATEEMTARRAARR